MRVVDKKVNYAGLLCCRELYQFADDPRYNNARAPAQSTRSERKWIKFIQFKRADFLAAPHHAYLCSEHFSECDFANPIWYSATDKVYKIALSEVLATQMGVTEAQHQSQLV